jgi:hypothetical protein
LDVPPKMKVKGYMYPQMKKPVGMLHMIMTTPRRRINVVKTIIIRQTRRGNPQATFITKFRTKTNKAKNTTQKTKTKVKQHRSPQNGDYDFFLLYFYTSYPCYTIIEVSVRNQGVLVGFDAFCNFPIGLLDFWKCSGSVVCV